MSPSRDCPHTNPPPPPPAASGVRSPYLSVHTDLGMVGITLFGGFAEAVVPSVWRTVDIPGRQVGAGKQRKWQFPPGRTAQRPTDGVPVVLCTESRAERWSSGAPPPSVSCADRPPMPDGRAAAPPPSLACCRPPRPPHSGSPGRSPPPPSRLDKHAFQASLLFLAGVGGGGGYVMPFA